MLFFCYELLIIRYLTTAIVPFGTGLALGIYGDYDTKPIYKMLRP